MQANEITKEESQRWKREGWIPVPCRICGEVMLFPSKTYSEEQLIGYECQECTRAAIYKYRRFDNG